MPNPFAYHGMDQSYAKPIVEQTDTIHEKELKRAIHFTIDGSCELYEALCAITHARNFLGTIPGIFLMTMLPSFGKSSLTDHAKNGKQGTRLSPEIDGLKTSHPKHALRPDSKSFYNDADMEL